MAFGARKLSPIWACLRESSRPGMRTAGGSSVVGIPVIAVHNDPPNGGLDLHGKGLLLGADSASVKDPMHSPS